MHRVDISEKSDNIPSYNMAIKKDVFGEGAERFVRRFQFLDDDLREFIGPKMVVKSQVFLMKVTHLNAPYHIM